MGEAAKVAMWTFYVVSLICLAFGWWIFSLFFGVLKELESFAEWLHLSWEALIATALCGAIYFYMLTAFSALDWMLGDISVQQCFWHDREFKMLTQQQTIGCSGEVSAGGESTRSGEGSRGRGRLATAWHSKPKLRKNLTWGELPAGDRNEDLEGRRCLHELFRHRGMMQEEEELEDLEAEADRWDRWS